MSLKIKRGFDFRGFVKPKTQLTVPDPPKHKILWPHQERFLKELRNQRYWFVVGPPAAGKSLTISAVVHTKLEKDKNLRAIITVPQTIIGFGFDDLYFKLGNREVSFSSNTRLHVGTDQTNQKALKRFLSKKATTPVRDRVAVCSHQSFVQAYQKFPKLFKDVLIVVDEAHHSKADEVEGTSITNQLGAAVMDLVKRDQQVGLATATASRGDGASLLGPYASKFKVSECPFDEYLSVCRWFQDFTFDFVLYDKKGIAEPVDKLLGDKRKRPPKTIIHIPNVHSNVSKGKREDLEAVYCGIAGVKDYEDVEFGEEDPDYPGVRFVLRGNNWITVVDLVDEKNREAKKTLIDNAHGHKDGSFIDVVIALNMFKEGANWRWAEKSIIIGYRGSFTELIQMVGRTLRDAPEKYRSEIHYVLPQQAYKPTDKQVSAMNDYVKVILLALLLEDVFRPVELKVRDPRTKKMVTIKTDLLSEALKFDTTRKSEVMSVVNAAVLECGEADTKTYMNAIVDALASEGVKHPKYPLGFIAKQILKTFERGKATVLRKIAEDVDRCDVRGVVIDLIKESKNPVAYQLYYTDAIGVRTLGDLRKSLDSWNEQRWQYMYCLLMEFVKKEGRLPEQREEWKGLKLGAWCNNQKTRYRDKRITLAQIALMENILGWEWVVLDSRWWNTATSVENFYSKNGVFPSAHSTETNEAALGNWCVRQRQFKYRLSEDRVQRLDNMPGWSWDCLLDKWYETAHLVSLFVTKFSKWPSAGSHNTQEAALGYWCSRQRRKCVDRKLNDSQITILTCIPGWTTETRWDYMYKLTKEFMDNNGRMPKDGELYKSENIGNWTRNQVTRYNRGKLSSHLAEILQQIDKWEWHTNKVRWDAQYALLVDFVAIKKRLPKTSELYHGKNLGTWVIHQITAYRRGKLSKFRTDKLEKISSWTWDRHADKWSVMLLLLNEFVAQEHRLPSAREYHQTYSLGLWCNRQRVRYREGKLTEDQICKLESIPGWYWNKE